MSGINYRKKDDTGPLYNPERDYAYITPTLMRIAVENLHTPSAAANAIILENNITAEELSAATIALAQAQRDFINAADPVSSLEQALQRHEFYKARPCVQTVVLASIGESAVAAWFLAVREVSYVGEESPAATDMARFTAVVREFASRCKQPWYDATYLSEQLDLANDALRARVIEMVEQLRASNRRIRELEDVVTKYYEAAAETASVKLRRFFSNLLGRASQSPLSDKPCRNGKCRNTGCTKTPQPLQGN